MNNYLIIFWYIVNDLFHYFQCLGGCLQSFNRAMSMSSYVRCYILIILFHVNTLMSPRPEITQQFQFDKTWFGYLRYDLYEIFLNHSASASGHYQKLSLSVARLSQCPARVGGSQHHVSYQWYPCGHIEYVGKKEPSTTVWMFSLSKHYLILIHYTTFVIPNYNMNCNGRMLRFVWEHH